MMGRAKGLAKHLFGRRGSAAVEFAMLAPGMTLLMAWGVDLGLMAHSAVC